MTTAQTATTIDSQATRDLLHFANRLSTITSVRVCLVPAGVLINVEGRLLNYTSETQRSIVLPDNDAFTFICFNTILAYNCDFAISDPVTDRARLINFVNQVDTFAAWLQESHRQSTFGRDGWISAAHANRLALRTKLTWDNAKAITREVGYRFNHR